VKTTVPFAAGFCLAALLSAGAAGAAPFAYITNQGSHDVSVIDLATQRVLTTVPVGRSPAGVVASSPAGRVYVSNPDSRTISVIDMRLQAVVDTLAAGEGPVGIDASADGASLYVADWYAHRLLVYDLRQTAVHAPVAAIEVGRAPAGVAAHPGGEVAYLAERDDDCVAVVDLVRQRVVGRVPVGTHPFALLHDARRERLYVLNVLSDDVAVLETRDPRRPVPSATVKVGKAPYGAALAQGGALLYVTNQHDDTVSVIDADSLQPVRTLTGFGYPEGVAAHAGQVYVVNWMDDNVAVLDAASGQRLRTIATGQNSRGFGAFIGAPLNP
jgi:YVTN family beta-propeller protein